MTKKKAAGQKGATTAESKPAQKGQAIAEEPIPEEEIKSVSSLLSLWIHFHSDERSFFLLVSFWILSWNCREMEQKAVREATWKAFTQALKQDFLMFFLVMVVGFVFLGMKLFFGM